MDIQTTSSQKHRSWLCCRFAEENEGAYYIHYYRSLPTSLRFGPYRSKGWESEISESLGFLSPLHPFSQLLCLCLCFVPNPLSLTTERSTVFPSDRLVFRDQILRRNIHAGLNLYRRRVAINIITLFEMSAWLTFWFSKSLPLLWKSIAHRSERETPSWPDGDDVNLYRDNFLGMDHQNKNRSKGTPHKRVSDVNKSAFFLSVISVDKSL